MLRSNASFRLTVASTSDNGPNIVASVEALRATGDLVLEGAVEHARYPSEAISLSTVPRVLIEGSRISRGALESTQNAMELDLELTLTGVKEGSSCEAVFVIEPS
jgi:hypothetical protein